LQAARQQAGTSRGGKGAMLWGWRRSFQIRPNGSRRRSIAFVVNQFGVKLARARRKFQVYLRKRDGRGPWVN